MTSLELLSSYSYVGDTITVVTTALILLLIHFALYFSNDSNFKLFKRAILFTGLGALFNVLFAVTCSFSPNNHLLILLFRDLYHTLTLSSLFIFLIYTRNLVDLTSHESKILSILSSSIFSVGLILDLISPLTHFGFYYDEFGWHDSTYLKPYTFVYIYALIAMGYLIVCYGHSMIKSIHHILFVTEIVCVVIVFLQNIKDSNTFTTFTFVLPIIVVLTTLHSMPYDQITGAMNADAFERYIMHAQKRKRVINYMVLDLDIDPFHELPAPLGKALHTFWTKSFSNAALFHLNNNIFILAIENNCHNTDSIETINHLINDYFYDYYHQYRINFKSLILTEANYIDSLKAMVDAIPFFFKLCPDNDFLYPSSDQIAGFERSRIVANALEDINNYCDLNDDRVLVYCQPIKNVAKNCFDTAEILMRIKLPDLGLIFPDQFISIAEDNGFIHSLSKIVLNKACIELRHLLDEGYNIDRISINFAISELHDENFCNEILSIIKANNIPYDKIAVELTESQSEADFLVVYKAVEYLRKYGIKFYLDDFGTGYSNLERILRLNLDIIKFDRSLLLYAGSEENGQYTLHHFSEVFESLDYKILFEGVENETHEKLCIDSHADYLQGYKFSKPIPFANACDFFTK